jgi:hypothetical protein
MAESRVQRLKQARKQGRNGRLKAKVGKGDAAQTVGITSLDGSTFSVWARTISDPDPMEVFFQPTMIPFTILVHGLPILLRYEDDGNYWIAGVDYADYLQALGGNVLPVNFADFIHTHQNDSSGGQLNASQIFNAGIVSQLYGGTGANLSASSVGSVFYQNAFGQFVAIPAVASGNVFRSAGLNTAPAWGKVVMTTDITGITPVANGGTGKSSNTSGVLLLGAGASAMTELAPGTSGNIAQSNGSTWTSTAPSFNTSVITAGQLALARGGTNADLSATGAGFLRQLTAGANVTNLKANFAATAAPAVSDDNTQGYGVGSLWLDTTNDDIYMAIDVSTGAAIWEQLNGAGGSSPWQTTSNVVNLVTSGDTVTIGSSSNLGKLAIVGDDDVAQFRIRAYGLQSVSIMSVEDSSGAPYFTIDSVGGVRVNVGQSTTAALVANGVNDNSLFATAPSSDRVGIGIALPNSRFEVRGRADEIQFIVRAHSTQTNTLSEWRDSDDNAQIRFTGTGGADFNVEQNDANFNIRSDTQANAWHLDGTNGAVQQLGNTPAAYHHMAASTTSLASYRVPAGTAPSSPGEGDSWNDSTQKAAMDRINGMTQSRVLSPFTNGAVTGPSNSTSESSILGAGFGTKALPANFWTPDKTVLIEVMGFYSTGGAARNLTLRVKYGSTTLASDVQSTTAATAGRSFYLRALVTCYTTGATGTVWVQGWYRIQEGDFPLFSTAAVTINTTTSNTLDVTAQFATADSNTQCRGTNGFYQVVA